MADGDDDFEELTTNPQNFTTSGGGAPPQTQSDKTQTPGTSKSSVAKGKAKKKGKKKKLYRGKLSPKEYYNKEMKIFSQQNHECLDKVHNQSWETEEIRDDEVAACNDLFKKQVEGAKLRLGMPSKGDAGEEKKAYVGDDAWKERYKKQTDQNFLMENLRTLTQNRDAPTPHALENLSLISNYKGNLINKMTVSSKLGPLMEATPLQLSALTPYFRLFKKSKVDDTVEEFQFTDNLHWNYYISPSAGKKMPDIKEKILNSSLGQGVGFKSFNWETTGTNLFSAPRTLSATLSLHFQSISELARTARNSGDGGPLWLDLIVPQPGRTSIPMKCPTNQPGLNDLLERSLKDEEMTHMSQNPQSIDDKLTGFDVLAEVGWNYSPQFDEKILTTEFKAAVDASRVVLDLTLVSHKFNFREEGTIDLQINYVARLEGLMDTHDANLFQLDDSGQDNQIMRELEEIKDKIKSMKFNMSNPYGTISCAEKERELQENEQKTIDKRREEVEDEIIKLDKAMEARTKELKWSLYQKFTTFLLQNKILFATDMTKEQYARGELNSVALSEVGNSEDITTGVKEVLNTKQEDAADKTGKTVEGEFNAIKVKNAFNKKVKDNKGLDRKHQRRVMFFYLGDLINFYTNAINSGQKPSILAAAAQAAINKHLGDEGGATASARAAIDLGVSMHELIDSSIDSAALDQAIQESKINVVLGDMTFLDYKRIGEQIDETAYEGLDDAAKKKKIEGVSNTVIDDLNRPAAQQAFRVNYNMAYLPISFDAYQSWFTSEVLNGSSVFTFKSFLQSLTTKLLVASLQSAENMSVNADLRRMLKEKTIARASLMTGYNKYIAPGRMHYEDIDPATKESTLLLSSAPVRPAMSGDSPKLNRQFLILHVSRLPKSSQAVNELDNAKEGVYHLKLGASRGLVKTISLNRESNSRIRDANIMRAYRQGGSGLGVIQEPYQADVKLFGSGFFQPGTYVYINPTNIGLGTSIERYSIARRMGIGGFYFVTKVSNTLSESGLQTSLKCYFQDYGYLPSVDNSGQEEGDAVNESNGPGGGPRIVSTRFA